MITPESEGVAALFIFCRNGIRAICNFDHHLQFIRKLCGNNDKNYSEIFFKLIHTHAYLSSQIQGDL